VHVRIISFVFAFLLSLSAAILLAFSFPATDISWLAWFALVPLLIALSFTRVFSGFFVSYCCGIFSSAIIYDWIFAAPGYQLLHHAILALIVGLYSGIFGLIYAHVRNRWRTTVALVCAPFIWVTMEYIRSNVSFLSLPFPTLAHTQYQNLRMIQAAEFTGAYGISFLIVVVNVAITSVILALLSNTRIRDDLNFQTQSAKGALVMASAAILLLVGVSVWGQMALNKPQSGKQIRVSVVQGNIGKEMKSNTRKYADHIMGTYARLTAEALKDSPDLVVWPEAATPGLVLKNLSLQQELVSLIRQAEQHFLIGSSEYAKFSDEPFDENKYGNTALFFSPSGKLLGQYLKIFLIPFGEYVPYEDTIHWPEFIVSKESRARDIPGTEFTLFQIEDARFGVVICSEGAFPNLFRKFVKSGADFMLNITNEGWFGESALHQKVAASVFRAVENRVPLARATNTGISCFINPLGEVYGKVRKQGREILVDGYLTQDLTLTQKKTIYTRFGNLFAYLNLMVVVVMIIIPFFVRTVR